MKILVVSNLYPPEVRGGYEILCAQVAEGLAARGHEITVLTTGDAAEAPDGPVTVLRDLRLYLPFDEPARLARHRRWATSRHNARVTAGVIDRQRPDVVFVWSQLRLTLGAALAAERRGVPVLYTMNDEHAAGYRPVPFGWRPRQLAGWLMDALPFRGITTEALRLERTVSISHCLADRLEASGLERPAVVHQGIPLERFPLKDEPGALGNPLRVLYTGQLHPDKGVHTLIEAVGLLRRSQPSLRTRVTICGHGDPAYRRRLEDTATRLSLDVCFTGRLPHEEVAAQYRRHDVFVFPSIWPEPFGLTHLEAMASGTPVISTTTGGQAEVVADGLNALTFEAGDALSLARRLTDLACSPDLARRLARTARRDVERRFSLDRYVTDLEQLLHETGCPAGGPRPAFDSLRMDPALTA